MGNISYLRISNALILTILRVLIAHQLVDYIMALPTRKILIVSTSGELCGKRAGEVLTLI